ncbi:MAG: hypothetical protein A2283_12815 [Lentisphaerae bacterium RIFOXYA12_FULL_48_11]|nr:MAG: hypothetical protein A2283_12815 [Lentisphaerae bacterium RIFOXYA12_FULL_48_11]
MIASHDTIINKELRKISHEYKGLKKFVDFGCGNGARTMIFAEFGREITGLDCDDYLLPEGKKHITFFKRNFLHSELQDNITDMVLCFDVVEHMEQPSALLQEIHRVMTSTGILILSTPNRNRLTSWPLLALGLKKYPARISKEFDQYPEYWHLTEYSEKQLHKLVEDNNFQVLEWKKIFYGLPGRKGVGSLRGLPLYHNHILILKKS